MSTLNATKIGIVNSIAIWCNIINDSEYNKKGLNPYYMLSKILNNVLVSNVSINYFDVKDCCIKTLFNYNILKPEDIKAYVINVNGFKNKNYFETIIELYPNVKKSDIKDILKINEIKFFENPLYDYKITTVLCDYIMLPMGLLIPTSSSAKCFSKNKLNAMIYFNNLIDYNNLMRLNKEN